MSNSLHMPGYRVLEYRLVLPLPEVLQDKITGLRKTLFEKHSIPAAADLKPAITLLKCHAYEKMEQKLVTRLQETAMGHHPFSISLQGFEAVGAHSIRIQVPTREPFAELSKALKGIRMLINVPQHDPQFFAEPQVVLAKQLKPMKFISMWMDCEHRQFNGRFTADAMLLLKRSPVSSRWEVLKRMEFMSRGAMVKQGELFA
jgi:hypothetical protein